MNLHDTRFEWRVCGSGYRWTEGTPTKSADGEFHQLRVLAANRADGAVRFRRYHPLSACTGLFRVLAQTAKTEEGVQSFADQFGLLGDQGISLRVRRSDQTASVMIGEPLDSWTREISELQAATEIWDLAERGEGTRLSKYYRRDPEDYSVAYWRTGSSDSEVKLILPNLGGHAVNSANEADDAVTVARLFVQMTINRHLEGRVASRLLWHHESDLPRLRVTPCCLSSALWLQLASAVDRRSAHRRCRACGSWFEVSPDAARRSRKYCTDSCRVKAHRRRKAAAAYFR